MRGSKFNRGLTIALEKDQFSRLKELTDRKEISLADFVRTAIEESLKKNETDTALRQW